MAKHLLVFGPGYTARPIMERAKRAGWHVSASYRSPEGRSALETAGYCAVPFEAAALAENQTATHILTSIAPPASGDPVLATWGPWLRKQDGLQSLHYLSSTNVYGDHGGDWVDEKTPPTPSLERGIRRVAAEKNWQQLAEKLSCGCFIYRLAGIYGPGRNALNSLKIGKARRVIKNGQVFGRIHLADIEAAIWAAATGSHRGGIFNLADDLPCPPQEVVEAAAKMLGMEPPAEELIENADMSSMARSFYAENKRVKNEKTKHELGLELSYPTYKEGLKALLAELK